MHCTKCWLESTVCCCPVLGSKERPTAEEVYISSKKRECEACEGVGHDGYQRVCQECDGWGTA